MRRRAARLTAAVAGSLLAFPYGAAAATRTTKATTTTRLLTVPTGSLTEVSGCAVSRRTPDRVWLHNDSGDGSVLLWLDLRTRATGRVEVRGAQSVDWEDIAPGPGGTLVVADTGDNARRRSQVALYRMAEPAADATAVDATGETLRYEDGPHDAEALVIDPADGTAYVVTKEAGRAGVYRGGDGVLRRVATVRITGERGLFPNLVTAADALPDGTGVVVRTYQRVYLLRKPANGAFADAFAATPRQLAAPLMLQPEAVCVTPDGRSFVTTSESVGASAVPVAVAPLPAR